MSTSKAENPQKYTNTEIILSPIKRDKLKKKLRLEEQERMRKSLPTLSRSEIRRYRHPYDQAIIIELEEDGFPSSSAFLLQILDYHAALCAEHGPDSIVSSRPKLQDSRHLIDLLYKGLIKAEAAHYDGKLSSEIDELLQLSIFFGLGSDDWWWLGEQLLIQSVNVSANFQGDGGEREAVSRFIFGKFLIENLKDAERAIEQLDIARSISLGKNWTAFWILKHKQKSVHMETCGLLSDCYLKLAYARFNKNNEAATKCCYQSITMGQEACEYIKVAEANLLKGRCDMNGNRYKCAISSFQKSLDLYQRMKMIDEACEARIQLALALLAAGNFTDSAYHLRKLLEYANDNDQATYMGRAYRYLGEYYLNHGSPHFSTPVLLLSMRMFHRLNDIENREQLKNLAAISQGQEALPFYIKLVTSADGTPNGSIGLQKLLAWKDSREPFWPQPSNDNKSLKERLKKDGLGAGLSEDDFDDDDDKPKKDRSPEEEELIKSTQRLRIPIAADIISFHADGPTEIKKDDLLSDISGKNSIAVMSGDMPSAIKNYSISIKSAPKSLNEVDKYADIKENDEGQQEETIQSDLKSTVDDKKEADQKLTTEMNPSENQGKNK